MAGIHAVDATPMPTSEITETVTNLASDAAGTLISTATSSLVVLVPVFAVFWGIRFALSKLKLNKAGRAA